MVFFLMVHHLMEVSEQAEGDEGEDVVEEGGRDDRLPHHRLEVLGLEQELQRDPDAGRRQGHARRESVQPVVGPHPARKIAN